MKKQKQDESILSKYRYFITKSSLHYLERSDSNENYGFNLKFTSLRFTQIVESIIPDSPAARSHLFTGQFVLHVNGVNVVFDKYQDVVEKIKKTKSLIILALDTGIVPEFLLFLKKYSTNIENILANKYSNQLVQNLESVNQDYFPYGIYGNCDFTYNIEKLTLDKIDSYEGYGFRVHTKKMIVTHIEENSPAQISGLKHFYSLLKVRDKYTDKMKHTVLINEMNTVENSVDFSVCDLSTLQYLHFFNFTIERLYGYCSEYPSKSRFPENLSIDKNKFNKLISIVKGNKTKVPVEDTNGLNNVKINENSSNQASSVNLVQDDVKVYVVGQGAIPYARKSVTTIKIHETNDVDDKDKESNDNVVSAQSTDESKNVLHPNNVTESVDSQMTDNTAYIKNIRLFRQDASYGFELVFSEQQWTETIGKVDVNSIADCCGMKAGDYLLGVNNNLTKSVNHKSVADMVMSDPNKVDLLIADPCTYNTLRIHNITKYYDYEFIQDITCPREICIHHMDRDKESRCSQNDDLSNITSNSSKFSKEPKSLSEIEEAIRTYKIGSNKKQLLKTKYNINDL